MTPRERVVRALTFAGPDRTTRDLWTLPGIERSRPAELARMRERFPFDITGPRFVYARGFAARGDEYRLGSYTDEWG